MFSYITNFILQMQHKPFTKSTITAIQDFIFCDRCRKNRNQLLSIQCSPRVPIHDSGHIGSSCMLVSIEMLHTKQNFVFD